MRRDLLRRGKKQICVCLIFFMKKWTERDRSILRQQTGRKWPHLVKKKKGKRKKEKAKTKENERNTSAMEILPVCLSMKSLKYGEQRPLHIFCKN